MSLNVKIGILGVLLLLIVSSVFVFLTSIDELENSKKSFHKLENELNVIKTLQEYYGEDKNNKKKLLIITQAHKDKILSIKENKESIEFTMQNLNDDTLNGLLKNIVDKGLKIAKMKIIRTDGHKAQLNLKVIF